MTAKIAHLSSRALISVSGPDWRSFLQGLITQDVETLGPGEMRYGAVLTPQGRLTADLFITGGDEGCVLDAPTSAREGLIAKLTLYRLRAKVDIEPLDEAVFAAWDGAADGASGLWLDDPRLPELGRRGRSAVASKAVLEDEVAYDAHRLGLGVGDPAKDGAENDYPIELNLDLFNGIDFRKGCFVGQETTSRMHRRGTVKTRMAPIVFQGPPPPFGSEVMAGERRAGEVRGGMAGRSMALLRIDRATSSPLTVDGRAAALDLPPWLARFFDSAIDETAQS